METTTPWSADIRFRRTTAAIMATGRWVPSRWYTPAMHARAIARLHTRPRRHTRSTFFARPIPQTRGKHRRQVVRRLLRRAGRHYQWIYLRQGLVALYHDRRCLRVYGSHSRLWE